VQVEAGEKGGRGGTDRKIKDKNKKKKEEGEIYWLKYPQPTIVKSSNMHVVGKIKGEKDMNSGEQPNALRKSQRIAIIYTF